MALRRQTAALVNPDGWQGIFPSWHQGCRSAPGWRDVLSSQPQNRPQIGDGQTHHQGRRAPSAGRRTSAIWKATCLGVTQGCGEKPWLWGTAQRTISLCLAFPEVSWRVRTLNLPWVLYHPAMKQLSSNFVKFPVVSTVVSFTLNF